MNRLLELDSDLKFNWFWFTIVHGPFEPTWHVEMCSTADPILWHAFWSQACLFNLTLTSSLSARSAASIKDSLGWNHCDVQVFSDTVSYIWTACPYRVPWKWHRCAVVNPVSAHVGRARFQRSMRIFRTLQHCSDSEVQAMQLHRIWTHRFSNVTQRQTKNFGLFSMLYCLFQRLLHPFL